MGSLVSAALFLGSTGAAEESANVVAPALQDHWAVIHVVVLESLPIKGEADTAIGYYQSLGVACTPGSLRALIEDHVSDGTVDWADSEVETVDPTHLDKEIREQIVPVSGEGIWYQSGRSFHGPE